MPLAETPEDGELGVLMSWIGSGLRGGGLVAKADIDRGAEPISLIVSEEKFWK